MSHYHFNTTYFDRLKKITTRIKYFKVQEQYQELYSTQRINGNIILDLGLYSLGSMTLK